MDGETGEFQDWEMLQNSDETGSCDTNSSGSVEKMTGSDGIEGDSEGMVRTNYFSPDSQAKSVKIAADDESSSVESDNPSWIDPGLENSYPRKESGDFWPDSGSEKSDDHKFTDLDAKDEFMFVQKAKSQVGFEGIGEIGVEDEELRKLVEPVSIEFGDIDTHDSAMGIGGDANSQGPDLSAAEEQGMECSAAAEGLSMGAESAAGGAVKSGGQEEKRSAVWWKLPFELLKYCASRVSPTWTFSVAAAIMGCLILGRRLYKMKRKTQSLQLKVTMDDKKVSQFMSRAARLNEAFSVVKRVPVIRPSLPAAGVTPWPVMNLR